MHFCNSSRFSVSVFGSLAVISSRTCPIMSEEYRNLTWNHYLTFISQYCELILAIHSLNCWDIELGFDFSLFFSCTFRVLKFIWFYFSPPSPFMLDGWERETCMKSNDDKTNESKKKKDKKKSKLFQFHLNSRT